MVFVKHFDLSKDPNDKPDPEFTYHSSDETGSYAYWGEHSYYSGNGYIALLGKDRYQALAKIHQ